MVKNTQNWGYTEFYQPLNITHLLAYLASWKIYKGYRWFNTRVWNHLYVFLNWAAV